MRGLKYQDAFNEQRGLRRTPRGVRGLKFSFRAVAAPNLARRTPRGVRGLKFPFNGKHLMSSRCRTPRGVRGLK